MNWHRCCCAAAASALLLLLLLLPPPPLQPPQPPPPQTSASAMRSKQNCEPLRTSLACARPPSFIPTRCGSVPPAAFSESARDGQGGLARPRRLLTAGPPSLCWPQLCRPALTSPAWSPPLFILQCALLFALCLSRSLAPRPPLSLPKKNSRGAAQPGPSPGAGGGGGALGYW